MTDEELGYIRINSAVCLFHEYMRPNKSGTNWNPHFLEHVADCNKLFNDLYKDKIIDAVGHNGWAVNFIQFSQENASWMVDIYVDKPEHYNLIGHLINGEVPQDMKFQYYYRGTVAQYLGQSQ